MIRTNKDFFYEIPFELSLKIFETVGETATVQSVCRKWYQLEQYRIRQLVRKVNPIRFHSVELECKKEDAESDFSYTLKLIKEFICIQNNFLNYNEMWKKKDFRTPFNLNIILDEIGKKENIIQTKNRYYFCKDIKEQYEEFFHGFNDEKNLFAESNSSYEQFKKKGSFVKKIILIHSKLEHIPDEITYFKNVKTLMLDFNYLTTLPKCLGELSNLETLSISGNEILSLPCEMSRLTNLTSLDLTGNKLLSIPEWIESLTKLKKLRLGLNNITFIRINIGALTNLTELGLSRNKLIKLPKSIGFLTNLTELYLFENKLTKLPKSIGFLTNLTELDLSDNKLTKLPKSIGNLTNLKVLLISYNDLEYLPDWVSDLKSKETHVTSDF